MNANLQRYVEWLRCNKPPERAALLSWRGLCYLGELDCQPPEWLFPIFDSNALADITVALTVKHLTSVGASSCLLVHPFKSEKAIKILSATRGDPKVESATFCLRLGRVVSHTVAEGVNPFGST